jgi:hypothetical protein
MQLSTEERVANGARWLDEKFPGWESRIDPGTLDLTSGHHCICGQVFDERAEQSGVDNGFNYATIHLFTQAVSWLGTVIDDEPTLFGAARAMGFIDHGSETYDKLQEAWVDLLKERANATV